MRLVTSGHIGLISCSVRIKIKRHKDMSLEEIGLLQKLKNKVKYFALNREHNWKNLYIQLRNQQACTTNNHNWIQEGPIFVGTS